MAEPLFGLDIAQIVADELSSAGGLNDGVLLKSNPSQRDASNPSVFHIQQPTRHDFQGYIRGRQVRREGSLVTEQMMVLAIIGNSLPAGVIPQTGDKATIKSMTWQLGNRLSVDAAEAVYKFEVS